ncbi:MAG TPA: tRNA (adenosine(37)-N6)-threonylcarbamoyltransferase complex dimerization subunit type 1 TsaB [Cerasibacillus sp.]|uniref:tRNA (adenosine(37)-N6)-threonylcarbamoyltransferase complex dimerization subunit type 1 TsaB n=1 Tax=Cerasibacillus sp. TaxID=2498711 RepID=UPI002F412352
MYTLAIDTSNYVLGVAITTQETVVGQIATNLKKNHSVRLMPTIDLLMKQVDIKPSQLEKIVVAKGPGSYTGVRIGLTTAKSLAWALNIPVVGVSSLESLAYQGRFHEALICPFFDARRGTVYTGGYMWQDEKMTCHIEESNILMADWLDILLKEEKEVVFLSPDIKIFQEQIKEKLGTLAVIPEAPYHIANPAHLALAATHHPEDSTHFLTPNYLRLAEAEAKWKQAQKRENNHG